MVCIIILITICIIFLPNVIPITRIDFILSTIITCATTFSGFTLTIVSILLSFSRSTLIEYLKKNNGIQELIFRYTFSLVLGLLLILFCGAVGSDLPVKNEFSKFMVILGAIILFDYLYNLITSSNYLLKTISLATKPTTVVSDEIETPKINLPSSH